MNSPIMGDFIADQNLSMRDRVFRMEATLEETRRDVRRILDILDGHGNQPGFKIRLDRVEQENEQRTTRLGRIEALGLSWVAYHVWGWFAK